MYYVIPTKLGDNILNCYKTKCPDDGTDSCDFCILSSGHDEDARKLLASNIEPFKSLREGTYKEPN